MTQIPFPPKVRPVANSIVEEGEELDEVAELRTEVAELKSRLEQLTKPVPVAPVMAKYSALQSGHGTFSHPPVAVNAAEGRKQRVVENTLSSIITLVSQTVAGRGGVAQVVRREDREGGLIIQISLPAAGVLAPSGVAEVLGQVTNVCLNEFPAARLDVLRQVSVGLGSPVSQDDGQHITTLRVLVPLPADISPVNNPSRSFKACAADDD